MARIIAVCVAILAVACGEQHREPINKELDQESRLLREIDSLTNAYVSDRNQRSEASLLRLAVIADSCDGSASEYLGEQLVRFLDPQMRCRFIEDLLRLPELTARSLTGVVGGEVFIKADGNVDSMHAILHRYGMNPGCLQSQEFAALVYADIVLVFLLNNPQEEHRFWFDQTVVSPAKTITSFYDRMKRSGSREDSLRFYKVMPRRFLQLKLMFGALRSEVSHEVTWGPLYDVSQEYLTAMFATNVSTEEHVKAILSLAVDGAWEAGAISILQNELTNVIRRHPKVSALQLSLMSEEDVRSIGRFLWDSPQVPRSRHAVIGPIKQYDVDVYLILNAAFEDRVKPDGGIGIRRLGSNPATPT